MQHGWVDAPAPLASHSLYTEHTYLLGHLEIC